MTIDHLVFHFFSSLAYPAERPFQRWIQLESTNVYGVVLRCLTRAHELAIGRIKLTGDHVADDWYLGTTSNNAMGKFYDEIPQHIVPWIQKQKIFWVATAPLSAQGHVHVSPKGFNGTFHIVDSKRVWYEDMSGSGAETVAHLREEGNGRMTIMFTAFEGAPQILRLFGTGSFHEFDSPEYNTLIPFEKRTPGSRAVIILDIHKVGTSCGYSIPFFTFKEDRMLLHNVMAKREVQDNKAASCFPNDKDSEEIQYPEDGMREYWKLKNTTSMDGLPALETAFTSTKAFNEYTPVKISKDGGLSIAPMTSGISTWVDGKLLTGIVIGVAASALWSRINRL